MTRLLRPALPLAMLLQLAFELCWLFAAVLLALRVAAGFAIPITHIYSLALVFALLIVCFNGIFGLYRNIDGLSIGEYLLRVVLAPVIGIPLAYLMAEILPGGNDFQEHIGAVGLFALGGLLLVRHAIVLPLVRRVVPHRVLVLGTGIDAQLVEASLANERPLGISLAGFFPVANGEPMLVAPNCLVPADQPLEEIVRRRNIDEIVVAVRQRRDGVLPLQALLACRLNGIQVTDLPDFFEHVHGRVPIELVKVSWLIYAGGYRRGWLRAAVKRTFDLVIATSLLVATLPLMAIVAAAIMLESGTPVIYRQTRVGYRGKHFTVLKFRSMAHDAETGNGPQWADLNDPRVTRVGRLIRRVRLDELPQLINVIRGEMSIIGPRPERPEFVAMLAAEMPLYGVRHSVNPGITGWAQVRYSYGATVEQAMRKLEYDLYYVKNHSLALDLQILFETIRVVMLGEGGR